MLPSLARGSSVCSTLLIILWLTCVLDVSPAQGQRFGRIEETQSNVAYFYHAQPGEATVQVSLWGTIPQPGIYEIPDSTDLDKLLTMAGGAPVEPRQENRDPSRVVVRVYRPDASPPDGPPAASSRDDAPEESADDRTLLFKSTLDAMLRGETDYPTLRDDDIVVVETIRPRQRFTWRDAVSILSSAGTLTLLALRIFGRR